MPSPFPGMDPYLELHWGDIHSRLVAYSSDALNAVLPDDLVSRVEERVAIAPEEEDLTRFVIPDVLVSESAPIVASSPTANAANVGVVADPIVLLAQMEPRTERYITIIDAKTERLVTVIEFLSPTNKRRGESMRDYRSKRAELLEADVSVVEIDLVREGDWLALLRSYVLHSRHYTTYRATIRRAEKPGRVELYRMPLRQKLALTPVPLRHGEQDVTLDLQEMINQSYLKGRYDRTDYRRPCDPPLEGQDAEWANEVLRQAGRQ